MFSPGLLTPWTKLPFPSTNTCLSSIGFLSRVNKKSHNLKAESCPKMGIFRTLSLGNCISNNPERTILRKWGEEPGNVEVFNTGQVIWTSRDYCELKKNWYLKLRNLVLFYAWEHVRIWVHWYHSFHRHLYSLEPVSCVFHILSSSVLTVGSGCSLKLPGRRCRYCSPFSVPLGLTGSFGEPESLMTMPHWFTDVAGSILLLSN